MQVTPYQNYQQQYVAPAGQVANPWGAGGQTQDQLSTYGQNPYGQNPYGHNPYGQNPYGQNSYRQNPYGQNPYGPGPFGQSPWGQPPPGWNSGITSYPRPQMSFNPQLPFLATLELPDVSKLTNDPILHNPYWLPVSNQDTR